MLHLGRAIEQVDSAMEYEKGGGRRPPKKELDHRLVKIGPHLRRVEENAREMGEAGLVIALAKPFQRLLKYHLFFRILLFRTNLVASEYGGVLKMVTEIETIVGSIGDKRIQEEHCNMWDVLGRIDGLDIKKLVVPEPSRILVEERRIPLEGAPILHPSHSQSGSSNGTNGERDLWLVVFNDVVMRCQRSGTALLPRWGASWWTTNPTFMTRATVKPVPTVRTQLRSKLRNLYKFLEARSTAHPILCGLTDEPSRSRRGMSASLFGQTEGLVQRKSVLSRF